VSGIAPEHGTTGESQDAPGGAGARARTGPSRANGTLQLRTMHPLDTSATALERQREAFRRMTPEQRLAVAAEMSDEIPAIAESGIRRRHPDYSDDEIRNELVVILLGREDADRGRARRISAPR
jgi:hypothetical protein